MKKVNVIFAVDQTTAQQIKQAFKKYREDEGTLPSGLTEEHMKALRTSLSGFWKVPNIAGTNYFVVSWYVPLEYAVARDPSSGLKWVEFITTKWPSKFNIIGAWNRDGSQYGTTLKQVENGTDSIENQDRNVTLVQDGEVFDQDHWHETGEIRFIPNMVEKVTYTPNGTFTDVPHYDTVVEGTPMYPIHAQYMKIFPDDITYDPVTGEETSRTAATAPKKVNKILGWGYRRWT